MRDSWKTIPGYPQYQSNQNCKIRKIVNSKSGTDYTTLSPKRTTDDYYTVKVVDDEGETRIQTIHKLGCLAFHGQPDSSLKNPTVDHKDGNLLNNDVRNLEWVSQSENVKRAFARKDKTPYKILCLETNQVFDTISAAQKEFGFRYYTIQRRSITGQPIHGFHFERIYLGKKYQHFKGSEYVIESIAKDCETLQYVVVYSNAKTHETWVRSVSDFFAVLDKNKYPDATQTRRFELK